MVGEFLVRGALWVLELSGRGAFWVGELLVRVWGLFG